MGTTHSEPVPLPFLYRRPSSENMSAVLRYERGAYKLNE